MFVCIVMACACWYISPYLHPRREPMSPKSQGAELATKLRIPYPRMKLMRVTGESALVQDGMLERNTVLLQKPFTLKRLSEMIQHMNSGVRG
jgi:hypothetical protein